MKELFIMLASVGFLFANIAAVLNYHNGAIDKATYFMLSAIMFQLYKMGLA